MKIIKNEITSQQFEMLLAIEDNDTRKELQEVFESQAYQTWFLIRQMNLMGQKSLVAYLGK